MLGTLNKGHADRSLLAYHWVVVKIFERQGATERKSFQVSGPWEVVRHRLHGLEAEAQWGICKNLLV